MFKNAVPPSLCISHKKHSGHSQLPLWRLISTNSAIHRGIRKSGLGRVKSGGKVGNERHRSNVPFMGGKLKRELKIRRPNHLQRQDVDDMAESARVKEGKRPPKVENYLHGGRGRAVSGYGKLLLGKSGRGSPWPSSNHKERSGPKPLRSASSKESSLDTMRLEHQEEYPKSRTERHSHGGSRTYRDTIQKRGSEDSFTVNGAARRRMMFGQDEAPTKIRNLRGSTLSQSMEDDVSHRVERKSNSSRKGVGQGVPEDWEDDELSKRYTHSRRKESIGSEGDIPRMRRPYPGPSDRAEERSYTNRFSIRDQNEVDQRRQHAIDVPITVPYTTPASEFLYGTSVVTAALKFSQRKLYKFYSYSTADRASDGQDQALRNLARSKGVEVRRVEGAWLRILDKMSTGRPHNVSYIYCIIPSTLVPLY